MSKDFDSWNIFKKKTHQDHPRPLFKEGEVWWCHLGANVGVEIDGKDAQFVRPVVVMRKFNRYSFYGLPLTTQFEENHSFYHIFEFNNHQQAANLTQLRLLDSKRLQRRMVDLPKGTFIAIKKALLGLLE
jgi:mRNA interferase MazF